MAQPAPNPLFNLPLDVIYDWVVTLYTHDPAALISFARATPEIFFSNGLDVAEFDASRQVHTGQKRVAPALHPLYNLAIHSHRAPLWFVRFFLDALANEDADAINGVFPSLRQVEPPLHAAVRAGRPDIVRLLLTRYQNMIQLDTVYQDCEGDGRCDKASRAHHPPCQHAAGPYTVCAQAAGAAVNLYTMERRPQIKKGIEEAAVRLIVAGQFPTPWSARSYVVNTLANAIKQKMFNYARAALHAILAFPPTSDLRSYLLDRGGLAEMYRMAARSADSTDLLRYLMVKANALNYALNYAPNSHVSLFNDDNLIIMFPDGTKPPHGRRHLTNALLVLRQAMHEAMQRPAEGLRRLGKMLNESRYHLNMRAAEENDVHQYFLLEAEATDLLLTNRSLLDNITRADVEFQFDSAANAAFWSGPASFLNARYLVQQRGYHSTKWLCTAIDYRNGPVLKEILNHWKGPINLKYLRGNLPFVGPIPRTAPSVGANPQVPPLFRCVQLRFISGIIQLLAMGIPTGDVPRQYWMALSSELTRDLGLYSRSEGVMPLEAMTNRYYYGDYRARNTGEFVNASAATLYEIDQVIRRDFSSLIETIINMP
ncbi:hypothetical protein F4820DRAFT_467215 [Hypoxylon rubiginosum]|uniref:Uncharacterized protein n=1 Tax=Hypoxylon rubiginosum TaxID=110542 RepID=A0ACB9Z9Y7_9PEZI|nr:hypothetical protein F4820DRAFT_467215 [Hypoxylon rubiginosum]